MMRSSAWPVGNMQRMLRIEGPPSKQPDVHGNYSGGTLKPFQQTVGDHVSNIVGGQLSKIAIVTLCWLYTVDMDAASKGYDFSAGGWVSMVVWRDVLLLLCCCGGWDWLLRLSPLAERLAPYKFNPDKPDATQMQRDIFWSFSALFLVSLQEVVLMRWWAGGFFKRALFSSVRGEAAVPVSSFFGGAWPKTLGFLAWAATVQYWRSAHFYVVHRCIHPWWARENTLLQGDIGAVLYRYVHSHHHRSYNPTAWSGISMLPIESVVYLSASLVPILFRSGCHPWLVLYGKLLLIIDAVRGHDGFDDPGSGTYFHQLHHAHFECNYGTLPVPMDWFFGTFSDGKPLEGNVGKQTRLLAGNCGSLSPEELSMHSQRDDCWVALHGLVLDVTGFLAEHPGGEKVLLSRAGSDVTATFDRIHTKSGGIALIHKFQSIVKVAEMQEGSAPQREEQSIGKMSESIQYWLAQLLLNSGFVFACVVAWYGMMGAL